MRQSVAPLVLHVVFVCSPGRSGQLQAEGADSLGKKQRAREKLLLACPFDWLQSDLHLVHFCAYECGCSCTSDTDAADFLVKLIEDACFASPPEIPATNKWNKVFPPIAWWCFICSFGGGIIKESIMDVSLSRFDTAGEANSLSLVDLIGPESDDTYRVVNNARWRKVAKWLKEPDTVQHLLIMASICTLSRPFLKRTFSDAAQVNHASIVQYVLASTNPALELVSALGKSMTSDAITLLDTGFVAGWLARSCDTARHKTATAVYTFMGGLMLRCVFQWEEWPYPLGKLVHPGASDEEKAEVVRLFGESGDCCVTPLDGFTLPLRNSMPSPEAVTERDNMLFIKDTFECCACTNILIEDRFARVRRQSMCSFGQSVGTAASNHVIGEIGALHRAAESQFRQLHSAPARKGMVGQRLG